MAVASLGEGMQRRMFRDVFKEVIPFTATVNPSNLADGAGETQQITGVTGAELGDFVEVSFSLDLQDITVTAYVQAADTVELRFQNESGGAVDLASGTVYGLVKKISNTIKTA